MKARGQRTRTRAEGVKARRVRREGDDETDRAREVRRGGVDGMGWGGTGGTRGNMTTCARASSEGMMRVRRELERRDTNSRRMGTCLERRGYENVAQGEVEKRKEA